MLSNHIGGLLDKKQIEKDAKSKDPLRAFLERIWTWTVANPQLVVGGAVLVLGVILAIPVISYFQTAKEKTAQEAFFMADKKFMKLKEKYDTAEREAKKPKSPEEKIAERAAKMAEGKDGKSSEDASSENNLPSGDAAKDYAEVIPDFDNIIEQHPGTKAAQMSALLVADLFIRNQKWDEALSRLGKVKGITSPDFLTAFVSYKYGNVLASNGSCDKAIAEWDQSLKKNLPEVIANYTKVAIGLCYETNNDLAQAERYYSEVANLAPSKMEGPGSESNFFSDDAKKDAEKYLRALKIKQQKGTNAQN